MDRKGKRVLIFAFSDIDLPLGASFALRVQHLF